MIWTHVSLLSISDSFLEILSRRVKASPIRVLIVSIRKKLWSCHQRISAKFKFSCFKVFTRSRIDYLYIWVELLCSLYKNVKVDKDVFSVLIGEVITHCDKQLTCLRMVSSFSNFLNKEAYSFFKVVWIHESLIINNKRVLKEIIKLKPFWTPIHIIHHMCLYLFNVFTKLKLPFKLKFLFFSKFLF